MDEHVLLAGFYFTRDEWESLPPEDRALIRVAMTGTPGAPAAETKTRPPQEAASGTQTQI